MGAAAPDFNQSERTDVEGCCWWGRGPIQTTGTCNYGKLNFYMGKRAADAGRPAIFPDVDFCKNPELICDPSGPPQLKWVVGLFYWLNSVQKYEQRGWRYFDELKKWVDDGMNITDFGFLDGASGIVNRGCHDPPCGTGDLHGSWHRREHFLIVLRAMGLVPPAPTTAPPTTAPPDDHALLCLPGLLFWGLLGLSW